MSNNGYLLGYDIGSSSIKASLIDSETGKLISSAVSPDSELKIFSPKPGWSEQDPEIWWEHVIKATARIRAETDKKISDVKAIGISYQMHGLVIVDSNHKPLLPSIIWCDSRAVEFGNKANQDIGPEYCLTHLLNSPGNFTASKLKWVQKNNPGIYNKIFKIMLPGDFIAMKLTGEICTTHSGLSEGIMWDFKRKKLADFVLDYYKIDQKLIPEALPSFSIQGKVRKEVSEILGVRRDIPVAYRAGDQPNNAFSLNVLNPGEIAATAGTSGVVYGVDDRPLYDLASRVNTFVHVNYTPDFPRYGILLCVNGTGILNSWIRQLLDTRNSSSLSYDDMNAVAANVPPGSDGLMIIPYGNGAERTLENQNIHASIHGIDFTRHTNSHLIRASQEGIALALRYGLDIMKNMGVSVSKVRAGYANMFLSPVFTETFATVSGVEVELYNTDGSQGAARGAGVGTGLYSDMKEAFTGLNASKIVEPNSKISDLYTQVYFRWLAVLKSQGIITDNS
ncbi:MAG: FGGY family carbohydrate kinase [Chitinispirillia bacterium]|jgi:xylulokinase